MRLLTYLNLCLHLGLFLGVTLPLAVAGGPGPLVLIGTLPSVAGIAVSFAVLDRLARARAPVRRSPLRG